MKIPQLKHIRDQVPPILVMIFCAFLTILAFVAQQNVSKDTVSLHASADAEQYQRTLQQGINSYMLLNRYLVGYFAGSATPSLHGFETFMLASGVLGEHSGMSYIGYLPRVPRAEGARREVPAYKLREATADPDYVYPYLFTFPKNQRALRSNELDYSAVPERWAAMQQARDSGQSTTTAKHAYVIDGTETPIIIVFTPVYNMTLPTSTVAERRIALRGFVFSICEIEQMIQRVMGSGFDTLFDLEIYDGSARADNILYDGDKRSHVVMADKGFSVVRQTDVTVASRKWELFFYPKPAYLARYQNWYGMLILLCGFAVSAALSGAVWIWYGKVRLRSLQRAEAVRFDAVFEKHPSAVYSLDLNHRFINANAQTIKQLKTGKDELIGKSVADFIVPENRFSAHAHFESACTGNSVSYDSAVFDSEGARVEINVVLIPIKVNNTVISVLGIAQNVTERKISEWQLMESKNMLRLVINHIPQRVFWKDTRLVFLGCNEAFSRDAGLSHPDEIIGKTDFDLSWRANAEAYRKDDIDTINGEAKINYEERQNREDGSASWLRTSKIPLTDVEGRTVALLGMYEDITERKSMEQRLEEMAHYDSLTGLANRAFFYHHLERAVSNARRHAGLFATMYLDLDRFKSINDTYGHDLGDALLRAFAHRIKVAVRETDLIARLGGDEFALLLDDLPDRAAAETVAGKLVNIMQTPFAIGDITLTIGTSIGLAFSTGAESSDDVIRRADQAMYKAKRGGRNRYEIDGGLSQQAA